MRSNTRRFPKRLPEQSTHQACDLRPSLDFPSADSVSAVGSERPVGESIAGAVEASTERSISNSPHDRSSITLLPDHDDQSLSSLSSPPPALAFCHSTSPRYEPQDHSSVPGARIYSEDDLTDRPRKQPAAQLESHRSGIHEVESPTSPNPSFEAIAESALNALVPVDKDTHKHPNYTSYLDSERPLGRPIQVHSPVDTCGQQDVDSDPTSSQDSLSNVSSAGISCYSLPPPAESSQPHRSLSGAAVASARPILHDRTAAEVPRPPQPVISISAASPDLSPPAPGPMPSRKIWVKRPGQSATMVAIKEDDLVDDVRDKILAKYANSLGRNFDAPDVTLRILARSDTVRSVPNERLLGPEEDMCRTLDMYYPGGQTVMDALVIDIPAKKTPRPSPGRGHHGSQGHIPYHTLEESRPHESGTDYFPPMPALVPPMSAASGVMAAHLPAQVLQLPDHARAISVLQTGQIPPLPSPGALTRKHRPRYGRQHTSSPTLLAHPSKPSVSLAIASPSIMPSHGHRAQRPRNDSNGHERPNLVPPPPPLPTPPLADAAKTSTPPTPLGRAERPRAKRPKTRNQTAANSEAGTIKTNSAISALLDGSVPPINVLIVEDNIINLKLLEAFMKRLKVRWSTAMNGQIAVNKWKQGGYHLVLMDIQLPIMSGLEATKEIRRLERVNGIGIFSSSTPTTPLAKEGGSACGGGGVDEEHGEGSPSSKTLDKLDKSEGLFKSPVIIVALTASSLQSDRHEALTAGCNDFLTKPVNFMWMERKVKEWGCMQALIDFDGWRQWKDFSNDTKGPSGGNSKTTLSSTAAGKVPSSDAAGKDVTKVPLIDGVPSKQSIAATDLAAKAREKMARREKRVSTEIGSSGSIVTVGGEGNS